MLWERSLLQSGRALLLRVCVAPSPSPPSTLHTPGNKNKQTNTTKTKGPTMEVVEMVLGGRVNKGLVSLIQGAGGKAVGLCGKDGDLLRARQMVEKDIG